MPTTDPPAASVNVSQSLYDLIERLTERLNRQIPVDLDEVLAAHPEHAEQLRQVWPSLAILASLRSADGASSLSFPPGMGTDALLMRGTLGDFRIVREIGRGGMGVVYEAEQISLDRRVALKVLPFAAMLDPRQLQRFRNESRAAAALQHPHIVPIYAVGCERGVHYYAMQFIDGRTLAEVIRNSLPAPNALSPAGRSESYNDDTLDFPGSAAGQRTRSVRGQSTQADSAAPSWRVIVGWGVQIAQALDYAHSVGVLHRDIKPANLLLDAHGDVWIADFGLAQIETDAGLTVTGDVLGTLRYMSPEQALGSRGVLTPRADVYSLGVTLYELLARRPAFTESQRGELLHRIVHDEPPPLRRLDGTLSVDLETIIHKAIHKDAAARYETAGDFADDLRRLLEDRPIRARRPTWADRLSKWSRRRKTLVRSVTAAALISCVSLTIAGWLVTSARQQSEIERLARRADSAAAAVGRRFASHHEYVTRINLADRALRLGNLDEGRAHLDACTPPVGADDLRGFEWRYLSGVAQPAFREIGRHAAAAYCVRRSPDGRRLASCGGDGIRIWDAATGELLQSLTEHTGDVNRIGFSPNGRWLASTSEDRTAIVWDTESWTVVKRLPLPGIVGGGEFTPDGQTFLAAELPFETAPGVFVGENAIHRWDTTTWLEQPALRGHQAELSAGDLSADGRTVVTGDKEGEIILWNLPDGPARRHIRQPPTRVPHDRAIRCIALAHRHPWLLTADWTSMFSLWNSVDGRQLHRTEGVFGRVNCARFSSDDALLVTGSDRAQIWQLLPDGAYREIAALDTGQRIWAVCFLGPDELAVADEAGRIVRWSWSQPSRRVRFHTKDVGADPGTNMTAAISPDGRWLATAGPRVLVHDLLGGPTKTLDAFPFWADAVGFSPNGRFLVGGSADAGKIAVWEVATWRAICTTDCNVSSSLRFQFPFGIGPVLVTDSNTAPQESFDLTTGQRTSGLPTAPAFWSPQSPHVAVVADAGLELRHRERVLWRDDLSGVQTATFAPDGRRLAIAARDRTIQIRAADTGERHSVCVHSHGIVAELVFSPDGTTLASRSEPNSAVTLFHVATGRELLTLPTGFQRVSTLAFSPQGDSLFVSGLGPDGYGQVVEFSVGAADVPRSSPP